MFLVLNTEFTLHLFQIDLPPKLIINKHFGSWFQILIYLVEGFTIGLSDANGRQADVFQSIESGASPGAETQFYHPFQRMVAFNVGLGETVFLFFKFYFSIVCTHVLPAFMYVHYMSAWYLRRSEEAIGSSGTGVKNGYELPWGTSSKLFLQKSSRSL